ncbi:speckle-type POZ protein [Parasteatoda tepidariorum]|uniref:speckle-type POZ protein n=1 Tax=Parasteatoda tepidariorum TaxID=114398 RepID=UPI00077F9046|nr:speckle-type POZ protein [Parasteatoda tepidariorum]
MVDDLESYQFVYTWNIKNFSSISLKSGEFMYSPWTLAESLNRTKWRFRFYPKGLRSREFPCFLLRAEEDDGPTVIQVSGDIGLVDTNGVFRVAEDRFRSRPMERGDNEGTNKFMSLERLFSERELLLANDTLTIQCRLKAKNSKKSIVTRCIAVSEIIVDKCLFQWNIRKFDSCHINDRRRVYVPLSLKFEIEFYLSGRTEEDGFVTMVMRKSDKKPLFLKCSVTLLDRVGLPTEAIKTSVEHTFTNEVTLNLMPKSKLLQDRKLYENDGMLTFQIELSISDGTTESCITELYQVPRDKEIEQDATPADLKKDLRHLYLERKFTDVQLSVGDGIFPAHRNVLSARSPVFQAMFEQDMCESKNGVVHITDIDSNTLDRLLMFIYSDTLDDLECESAFQLYSAAEKYFVEKLKVECEKLLIRKLSSERVLEILLFADLHNAENLKSKAEECVVKNATRIIATEEWEEFVNVNPSLASKIVNNLSKRIIQTRSILGNIFN